MALFRINQQRLSFVELVAITAAVMALNAFAIDMMLPALTMIGTDLAAPGLNSQQLVIGSYIVANGIAQLFFGPLVDHFGRRRVLLWALGGYLAGSLLCVFAGSFPLLIAARAFQGAATAGARVSVLAIVRDSCAGREMARVMSLAITVFMAAPILAPSIGQLVLVGFPWRGIFFALFLYGGAVALWVFWRAAETLSAERAKPLALGPAFAAYGEFIRHRISMGYSLASALCFGALFGFISASEQIFHQIFEIGDKFALAFAVVAGALAAATLTNAGLVNRFGMRRMCHGAILLFIISNAAHLLVALIMGEHLMVFMVFMAIAFFSLGLIGPNCGALAMEPMGHMAGAAAAANGFAGTTIAGFLGALIGLAYNGTTLPIVAGFFVLGLIAFGVIMFTEGGRLFRPGEGSEPAAPALREGPATDPGELKAPVAS